MIVQAQWKWTLTHKTQMNFMQQPGIEQELPGILKKQGKQVVFIKVPMVVIPGN